MMTERKAVPEPEGPAASDGQVVAMPADLARSEGPRPTGGGGLLKQC